MKFLTKVEAAKEKEATYRKALETIANWDAKDKYALDDQGAARLIVDFAKKVLKK